VTEAARAARPAGPPIALQLVALLICSLIGAQAMTLAVVLLAPLPKPAVYRLSEVAEALRGGSLSPRYGRPLARQTAARAPDDAKGVNWRDERARRELAALLGVPEARVALAGRRAPWWSAMFGVGRGPPGGPRDVEPGRPSRQSPPDGRPPGQRFAGPERALFDDFTAAVEERPGRWMVVTSTPEPFPNDWQRRVCLWFIGSLALVAPAGYLFARRITAPLRRFAQAAERLGRDPHAAPLTLSGPAEVGAAARAFNEMQGRIRRYVEDRTAMVGAISHDLRTPLARIRFKVEAAPAPMKAAILSDIGQMETMISAVLSFIRDASEPSARERLDLLSLVECVVDDAALVGGDVAIVDEETAAVLGDPAALQRLFANLIGNALKYGSAARVRVSRAAEAVRVDIEDDGPGLPSAELERVFQPFYRSDRARNLDQGGVGLGLALARSTARAHGGDIVLTSCPAGLTATVTLPAIDPGR